MYEAASEWLRRPRLFKVLPADGIHPRFASFQQNPRPGKPFDYRPGPPGALKRPQRSP